MNLIRNFENRVSEAFGSAPQGYTVPLSFKRLAKQTAKQMEAETYVVDGVDTAPALYTVLVSAADDTAMRPLYPRITQEIVGLVKAQAQAKGYVFVGEPLARFLADPKLRSGKFSVFAENVDLATLERLRIEERSFLMGASAVGGAAADRKVSHGHHKPTRRSARDERLRDEELMTPVMTPAQEGAQGALDSLDAASMVPTPAAEPAVVAATPLMVADSSDLLDDSASMGLDIVPVDFLDNQVKASHLTIPDVDVDVPMTQRRVDPVNAPAQEPALPTDDTTFPTTCVLVDRQTGHTYVGTAPVTQVGRERLSGSIVLRDPNVSRRHAELSYDGVQWYIRDLGSTNGTLVNDVEVTQCALHDGDLITVGLMNLEFREG